MNTPDTLINIARHLPSSQAAALSLVTRDFPIKVNQQYNVYYIAIARGYPYFKGMTYTDLYIYENSTLSEIMYQAGKFGDERVIYYWLGHTITDEYLDTDDVKGIEQACIGLVQEGHDNLLIKVMDQMYTSISIDRIIVSEAAEIGNIRIVETILDIVPSLYPNAARVAATYGHTTLIWLLINKGYQDYNSIMIHACFGGHENIVEDMLHLGATNYDSGLENSILSRNISLVRRMLQLGANPVDNEDNVGHSNMEIVRLLEDAVSSINETFNYDDLLNGAAHSGNDEIFDYALSKGANLENALTAAVQGGHINMVRKVMDLRVVEITVGDIQDALTNCRMDIVNVLTEKIDVHQLDGNYNNTLWKSGEKGCIPAVIWCLNNGAEISKSAIIRVARVGKVDTIKILLDRSGNEFLQIAIDMLKQYGYYRKAEYLEQVLS